MKIIYLKKNVVRAGLISCMLLLSACLVGPNYVKPTVEVPEQYKEAAPGWKFAQPADDCDRGSWWDIFHDPELSALESEVSISNQNVISAEAQYRESLAIVSQARASLFPLVSAFGLATVQKAPQRSGGISGNSFVGTSASSRPFSTYQLELDASWVPDLWGSVRRTIEANVATAQATAAQLAAMRLSMQGTLAQDYYQLRTLDSDQVLLTKTVSAYRKILGLTQRQFKVGTASLADVAQATAQLKGAEATLVDIGVSRAQFEHAIAVLIGKPASSFAISPHPLENTYVTIPLEVPAALLERRPDVAQAERQVAAANASIGVAIAAYFPTLSLTGDQGFVNNRLAKLFTNPSYYWSLGAQIMQTIFDGGLRRAQVAAARANWESTVALYRQAVLAAFQNVEDNLSAVRILESEATVQRQAVAAAKTSLRLQLNDFAAGTVAYTPVLLAQVTAYTNEKTAVDIAGRRMVSAVGLMVALGGGWDSCSLAPVAKRVPLK